VKKTRIKPISDKQKLKNMEWRKITLLKWASLGRKCQWCGAFVRNPSGHHIIKRRFNIHTKENCYVCHELPCHRFIEDNNIDVEKVPSVRYLPIEMYAKWLKFIGGE